VFITHGGLLGFQEAIYHAVPLLMLPFGNDQKANAAKARREGIGLKLDWHDIDEQKIINVLSKLTKDLR
jgi:glucuronosyltransferase